MDPSFKSYTNLLETCVQHYRARSSLLDMSGHARQTKIRNSPLHIVAHVPLSIFHFPSSQSSFVRASKFRHIFCDQPRADATFQNLRLSTVTGNDFYSVNPK